MRVLILALVAATAGACTDSEPPSGAGGSGGSGGEGTVICGQGFEADEIGCVPVLPAAPCAPGQVALPGETECRPVAPCSGRWGDAPIGPDTQFVDASYGEGGADGSEDHPWPNISAALGNVPPGGVVAITDGHYSLPLPILSPVRLWGSCPQRVTISQPGENGINVLAGGSGTEIHDLSVTDSETCLFVLDAAVRAERVWLHGCQDGGATVASTGQPAAFTLVDSLVEDALAAGVTASLSSVDVQRSVVRNIEPKGGRAAGGIVLLWPEGQPSVVSDSVLEAVGGYGVVALSAVELDGVVIARVASFDGLGGDGVALLSGPGLPGSRLVRSAVMDSSRVGVASFAAHVELADLRLECNSVHLNGETSWNTAEGVTIEGSYDFVDGGGNLCACQGIDDGCHVLSTGIEPPDVPSEP